MIERRLSLLVTLALALCFEQASFAFFLLAVLSFLGAGVAVGIVRLLRARAGRYGHLTR